MPNKSQYKDIWRESIYLLCTQVMELSIIRTESKLEFKSHLKTANVYLSPLNVYLCLKRHYKNLDKLISHSRARERIWFWLETAPELHRRSATISESASYIKILHIVNKVGQFSSVV